MLLWKKTVSFLSAICFAMPGLALQFPVSLKQIIPLPMSQREEMARPLLLQVELDAPSFDPSSRAFLLYRAAGAWLPLDKAHAIRLYREAFASAQQSSNAIRGKVEAEILEDLLPLSIDDVIDLLPKTEPDPRSRLYLATIHFALSQGDYATAERAFDRSAETVIPWSAVGELLSSLPAGAVAERSRIFTTAFESFAAHPASGYDPNLWTYSRLIARFGTQLPSKTVLPAIDIVLDQAAKRDKERPGGSGEIGAREQSISYHSVYDVELFVVATALQSLDPEHAAALLAQHPETAGFLKRFPAGLASFDPHYASAMEPVPIEAPRGMELFNEPSNPKSLTTYDLGLEFTVPRDLTQIPVRGAGTFYVYPSSPNAAVLPRTGICPHDIDHVLELARSVPISRKAPSSCGGPIGHQWCNYYEEAPRAHLLQALAERCSNQNYPAEAETTLRNQMEVVAQMDPEEQMPFLATAADLYLRLGDADAAESVIETGLSNAAAQFLSEAPNYAAKSLPVAVWPAAETYRRMVTLGVTASLSKTQAAVDAIQDPALRDLEEVMLSRALLGVPVRRFMRMNPSGASSENEVDDLFTGR